MRKIFAKVHLWLSIPFGLVIVIVCLTGSILVFEKELLELCYPSRYFVKEVKDAPLAPSVLMLSARKQLPEDVKINGLRVFSDPVCTYQLVLPGKKAAAFIDPYTGEVTGMDDGTGFFLKMMRLHRWLLDEYKRDGGFSWGKSLVGYATLVMVVILVSGLAIWYPRNRKMLSNRLKVKTGAGWRRFFYDLHVSGGFYATLLLLVMSMTGLTWSFDWYRNAFYSVFGVDTHQTRTHAHAHTPAPSVPEGKGHGKKGAGERKGAPQQDYTHWEELLSTLRGQYTAFNSITIQDGSATVSAATYGNTRGSDRYSFDPASGEITDVQLYRDLPASAKIRGWIYSVHVGSWGGVTTRILSCVVSFLGAVFALTGYYFWIKKKMRRRGSCALK